MKRLSVLSIAVFLSLVLNGGASDRVLAAGATSVADSDVKLRDGRRFDTGHEMSARAPGAPKETEKVTGFVGQWDVLVTRPGGDPAGGAESEPVVVSGLSEITFMNRGHGLMERFHVADLEGRSRTSILFLGYNPGASRWWVGGADNRSESAWAADGGFEGALLVLSDTRRVGGGVTRTDFRYSFEQPGKDALRFTLETSADGGKSWTTIEARSYARRPPSEHFLASASDYGTPDPLRPKEAAAFDFLVGEWTNAHDLTFPNGQQVKFTVNGTAVHVLDGAGVLEFNWFDTDPNLPDAATTILRIYNRAMRRWESLYATNRGNGMLVFGGRQEGDRIVLGNFAVDTTAALIPRYIFHSATKDSYSWYAESSRDHGATWTKTWFIEGKRNPPSPKTAP